MIRLLSAVAIISMAGIAVAIDKPSPPTLRGMLMKVDGTNLILNVATKSSETKAVTVATDEKTKVSIEGKPGKLSDLKKGQRVVVTAADGTATGVVVEPIKRGKAPATPWMLRGTVMKVNGSNLIVKVGEDSATKEVTVHTDEQTTVVIEGKPGKLVDLKEGQSVVVNPAKGTATHIIVPVASGK